MKTIVALLIVGLSLSACTVGPLMTHESARSVGSGNTELVGGGGNAGYVAKLNYGLGKDWDIGIQSESYSLGIRTKYAFINGKEHQWSLAAAAGTGLSIGGTHYYGDLITSYLSGSGFEPNLTVRLVHVTTDPIQFKDKDTGVTNFTVDSFQYSYGQVILGSRYWFSKHWIMSAEVSSLFALNGLTISNGVLASAAFGYQFN